MAVSSGLSSGEVHVIFGVVSVASAVLVAKSSASRRPAASSSPREEEFWSFQALYLSVYLLMVAGDWLQGPYMYALYDAYGYTHDEIATLFVAGFGSSMIFGTFVGSLADTLGRKRGALCYVATYVASCLTKHWRSYRILMAGRVLGGIATSLLFSVFDAWVVAEHAARNLDPVLLGTIFANAQAGNSIVAIAAGVLGEAAVTMRPLTVLVEGRGETKNDGAFVVGGYATPFDLAAACLCVGGAVIALEWSENYGTPVKSTSLRVVSNLQGGAHAVARDSRILLLGGVSACFEAAMYAFVFEWTPSLKVEGAPDPPYGEIFSIMMLACMCGTRVFGIAQRRVKPDRSTRVLLLVSVAALAVPATTAGPTLCVLSFLVFEVCVGVYFPAVSTLKSNLVPDAIRSTVYNLFRVPLNLLVLAILLSHISTRVIFLASVALLVLAALMQHRLCLLLLHADASAEPKTTTTTIARLDDRDDDDKKPLYETADV